MNTIRQMVSTILVFAIGGVLLPVVAATIEVPAGDSAAFRKAVYDNAGTWNTVVLPPGSYDASGGTERVAGYHLDMWYVRIRGKTGNPRDVVIYGDGTKGIMAGRADWSGIYNVTVSNGCKTTSSGVASLSYVSNCVITCCKATGGSEWGGALNGCGNVRDSEICYNSCAGFGGAAAYCTFYGCKIHHNTAAQGGAVAICSAYDSEVYENTASNFGGAFTTHLYAMTLDGCMVVSNRCTGSDGGGAVRNNSSTMKIRNCTFAYNTCSNGTAGAVVDCTVSNCVFIGNFAKNGGAVSGNTVATDCQFIGNEAQAAGGAAYAKENGASGRPTLCRCVVSNNVAGTNGGGIYYSDAKDTRIVMNRCKESGGGLIYSSATNCVIAGNATVGSSGMGGGVYDSTCRDSRIYNNFGALGSACHYGKMYDCVVSNNVSTIGIYTLRNTSESVGCYLDVQGIDSPGRLMNCVITGAGRETVWAKGDNVYTNGTFKALGDRCIENTLGGQTKALAATNCLFTGNVCSTLIQGPRNTKDVTVRLSSCTIAGNRYSNLIDGAPADLGMNGSFAFDNCIVSGNRSKDGTEVRAFDFANPADNSQVKVESCLLEHVVEGWSSSLGFDNVIVAAARFYSKVEAHPYSLKYFSPGRGKGIVRDWMRGANDIRGEGYPRLDGDKVDIGCYQCWLDPSGVMLLLR